MNSELLSKIGGANIGYIELVDINEKNILFYAINTDPLKTISTAAKGKINQIDYFTLRDLEKIKKDKIKNNLLDLINKTVNYKDKKQEEDKIDTNKTAFDVLEEIKTAKINFYCPEKTIPVNDYLNFKANYGKTFTKKDIKRINNFLIKTYKDYYGFCEYVAGLRNKN